MALNTFFAVNMPYGIKKDNLDQWTVFNREYMPLGHNDPTNTQANFIYTPFRGVTEAKLEKLAWGPEGIKRDAAGNIIEVIFYNEQTNPAITGENTLWSQYMDKIKEIAQWHIKEKPTSY